MEDSVKTAEAIRKTKKPKVKTKNWISAVLVMTMIFVFSSTSGKTIEDVGLGNEAYHIGGHFVLFIILCFSFYKATKNLLLSILLTILYAVFDEIHQLFVPLRSASLKDILTDTAGSFLSGGILWKLQHLLPQKLKNWLNN